MQRRTECSLLCLSIGGCMGFKFDTIGITPNTHCYIILPLWTFTIQKCHGVSEYFFDHGPLARYDKLRVAHAPRMLGAFFPPLLVSDLDMHYGTCVTHLPWCMPGSPTNGFLWSWWRGNIPGIPGAWVIRNFTYLARGPFWVMPYGPIKSHIDKSSIANWAIMEICTTL